VNKTHWLVLALLVSIGLNLLVAGMLAGRALWGGPALAPMPLSLGWVIRDLDDETRTALRPRLIDHARQARPLRRDVHEAQREFNRLLQSEEVEQAELQNALNNLRQSADRYEKAMHDMMAEIIVGLEPDQRRRIARFLQRKPGPSRDGLETRWQDHPDRPPGSGPLRQP
jgi:uncharacterized membrane protein